MPDKGKIKSIKARSWLQFAAAVVIVVMVAIVGSFLRVRIDLTEDKRYTLSEPTRKCFQE